MISFLSKIFGGNKSEKDVKKIVPQIEKINQHFASYQSLSNDALRNKTQEFKQRISAHLTGIDELINQRKDAAEQLEVSDINGKDVIYQEIDELKKDRDKKIEEALEEILPEAFAVVKETSRRLKENTEIESIATELDKTLSVKKNYIRIEGEKSYFSNTWTAAGGAITWNMVHYDVQLIGGAVLHSGKIAEMATGEGKTLVSTLPAYLNALAGEGVHIVTVNDYLARRDSEWNGPLFEWLGITVDCIDKHEPNSDARRAAYNADITYGTNNEFGFDYLRDNMVHSPD
ncbi:MAG: preprotein translocase subunit SecA, partial [Ferruginibacter sp.]